MGTIEIKYVDIPTYLHAGDFYRNLDSDDPEGSIQIPTDCFHEEGKRAADLEEFRQLLRVMVFWALDDIPLGVLGFCNEHNVDEWGRGLADLPGTVNVEVQPLLLTAFSLTSADVVPFGDIVRTGRWDLIVHAVGRMQRSDIATAVAALYGNLRLLKYLHEVGFNWHKDTCAGASEDGHLNCLKYARENGCPWDVKVHIHAAVGGHLSCMQYAHQEGLEWHADVCKNAALNGQLDCLQFAHEHGCPWDGETTTSAAQNGHIDCLRYALTQGCPVEEDAMNAACMHGQLQCVQLLHRHGAPWSTLTSYHAALCPQVACLVYLHAYGCPWDEHTPNTAASNGYIELLRYAMEQGCPYLPSIVQSAARSGNLESLRYVIEEQGLIMNNAVIKIALLRGNLSCVQYLLDHDCPFLETSFPDNEQQWRICDTILQDDNPEFVLCVTLAVERGWVPCENFINYIVTRDEPCKQWLQKEQYYTSDDVLCSETDNVPLIPDVTNTTLAPQCTSNRCGCALM